MANSLVFQVSLRAFYCLAVVLLWEISGDSNRQLVFWAAWITVFLYGLVLTIRYLCRIKKCPL